MLEIVRLDLQEAKHGHDFANRHTWSGLKQIEETWNVLLHVKLDLDVGEGWAWLLPHILQPLVGNLLELVHLLKELVHVLKPFVEDDLLRFFCQK